MRIEWDPDKAKENRRKHGADFADAAIAVEDENALTIEDRDHEEFASRLSEWGLN
jgi:uncharacterized DUF497 family protein